MTQPMTTSRIGLAPRPLRRRLSELTREAIFEALSGLLAEGVVEFSVQDVADRAGVSHRTVYRHFATREALLRAHVEWLEGQIRLAGAPPEAKTAAEIPAMVRTEHEVLDAFGPVVTAVTRLGTGIERGAARRVARNRAIRLALGDLMADLDPGRAEAVFWVIRCLTSSATWTFMREEGGIDGRRSGEAVAWAIDALLEALRRGDGPGAPVHGTAPDDAVGTLPGGVSDGHEHVQNRDRTRRGRGD